MHTGLEPPSQVAVTLAEPRGQQHTAPAPSARRCMSRRERRGLEGFDSHGKQCLPWSTAHSLGGSSRTANRVHPCQPGPLAQAGPLDGKPTRSFRVLQGRQSLDGRPRFTIADVSERTTLTKRHYGSFLVGGRWKLKLNPELGVKPADEYLDHAAISL